MPDIVLIAHNLRSTHNVGSLLRTADGLGVTNVWLTGYTPYPLSDTDTRLPHLARKIDKQIQKTALGAELSQPWTQSNDIIAVIDGCRSVGYVIAALEQTEHSVALPTYSSPEKLVIIVGHEAEGLESEIIGLCDLTLEIPMLGEKESFNVVQAAAMVLYHCRYFR